jgi:hypothetical protein
MLPDCGSRPHPYDVRKTGADQAMAAYGLPTQPIDATLYLRKKMECDDGLEFSSRFHSGREDETMGSLAAGESLKAIGRAFGKPSSSIYNQVAPHRGSCRALRCRSRLALTLSEREEISMGLAAHQSARSMARLLGRSAATASRELRRNGGQDHYRAALADEKAWIRARRPKRCKLARSLRLRQAVASKLRLNWAPEQIAGWLTRTHPDDESYRVSHETIYRSLFVQARGGA